MAGQAAELPFEPRRRRLTLIEGVENNTLLRVVRRKLQRIRAAYPTDGDAVVEKQRPRILRRNEFRLHARLRKDDDLRLERNAERAEHRGEVSAVGIEGELRLAG